MAAPAFDISAIALAVVGANASVAVLVLLGIVATYFGIWDKQGISDLGKMVFHMSMPALVFSKVLFQISVEHLKTLWILPVFCVLHVMSAYVVMQCVNKLVRLNVTESKATSACIMFGNCGSLAIAVMQSLCMSEPLKSKMGGQDACTAVGVSDCAFYVIAWNILIWGVGDMLLFPEEKEDEEEKEDQLPAPAPAAVDSAPSQPLLRVSTTSVSLPAPAPQSRLVRAQSMVITKTTEEPEGLALVTRISAHEDVEAVGSRPNIRRKTTFGGGNIRRNSCRLVTQGGSKPQAFEVKLSRTAVAEIVSRMPITGGMYTDKLTQQKSDAAGSQSTYLTAKDKIQKSLSGLGKTLQQFSKSPPIRAAGAAIVLGIFPPVKALFVGPDAPLSFVMNGINQMGAAQVPVSMVMLSGSGTLRYLEKIKAQAKEQLTQELGEEVELEQFHFSKVAVFLILFGRLLIMPFVGYFWWRFFVVVGAWPVQASLGFEYGDGMLGFICLIESCVPTAQTIVTMFIVHGDLLQGGAIAELILLQYGIAVVLFSIVVSCFEILTL
mmetsp:Transcript_42030/g.91793  ORF Transcript_42030/g.91793 Transcript_42030/m.91793 type:complete len:550 (-) Transcript_42030:66-1715(-)